MLVLIFQASNQSYALEVSCVEEVIPCVSLRPLSGAPEGVVGVLNYRGAVIPVVDLSSWMGGSPARNRLSTRMAILRVGTNGVCFHFALLVEGATETKTVNSADIHPLQVAEGKIPCLGGIFVTQGEMVQLINPQKLLTGPLNAILSTKENKS